MMNFTPYDHLAHKDDYNGMNAEQRIVASFLKAAVQAIAIVAALLICALLGSCTTTEYVPVVQTNTEHHWHTDSVHEKDSTYHEKTTTIMQLDSAAMAQYGIQLKSAERAWLVKTAELERQIQQLMQLSHQKDSVHDSIPYPVEVIKEVPAKLNATQKTLMWIGIIALMVAIMWVAVKVNSILPRR